MNDSNLVTGINAAETVRVHCPDGDARGQYTLWPASQVAEAAAAAESPLHPSALCNRATSDFLSLSVNQKSKEAVLESNSRGAVPPVPLSPNPFGVSPVVCSHRGGLLCKTQLTADRLALHHNKDVFYLLTQQRSAAAGGKKNLRATGWKRCLDEIIFIFGLLRNYRPRLAGISGWRRLQMVAMSTMFFLLSEGGKTDRKTKRQSIVIQSVQQVCAL